MHTKGIKGSWRVLIPFSSSQNTGAEGVGRDRVDRGWTQDLILVVEENVFESKTYKDRSNDAFSYFKTLETFLIRGKKSPVNICTPM